MSVEVMKANLYDAAAAWNCATTSAQDRDAGEAFEVAMNALIADRDMSRFSGNPKPLCWGCERRLYGREKDGGWWCDNCEQWVVEPVESAGSPPETASTRETPTMADDIMEAARARLLKEIRDCIGCVRGDSSAPVGDCSTFVDALIAAVRADRDYWHSQAHLLATELEHERGKPVPTSTTPLPVCPECDGRGKVLDAPNRVLDGHSYWVPCEECKGTGHLGPVLTRETP